MCLSRFILISYGGTLITCACFASVNCGPRTAVARVVGEYSGGQNSFPGLKSFPDTLSGNQPFSETSDAKPDQNSPLIINADRSTTMTSADQLAEYYNKRKSLFLSLLLQSLNHPLILLSLTQQLQPSIHQRRYCVENEEPSRNFCIIENR